MLSGIDPKGMMFKKPPRCLRGFEHIKRYWDKTNDIVAAKILPGEYYVTTSDEMIVTVLGSCISVCINDPLFGVGGMNHFMLPLDRGDEVGFRHLNSAATRYGNYAMEALINDILKNGGRRESLELKIFGGGRVMEQMTNIGKMNIDFIHEFVNTEGLKLVAENVGDIYPRKIHYFPQTGRVMMKKLRSMHNQTIIERETSYLDSLGAKPIEGEIDLF